MITGDAWQDADSFHPWAYFDPDAERIIAFGWADWLAATGSTYTSHEILTAPEFEFEDVAVVDGAVQVRVKRKAGATVKFGKDYFVTCRITAANTEVQDKTLFLRMQEF